METLVALIAFGLIATLVMPELLTKELLAVLVALAILTVVRPNFLSREQVFALIAFGVLFTLVIPPLLKK